MWRSPVWDWHWSWARCCAEGVVGVAGVAGGPGRGPGRPHGKSVRPMGQRTRPYQTLLDQILASLTTSPDLGECQIFPAPA